MKLQQTLGKFIVNCPENNGNFYLFIENKSKMCIKKYPQ